MLSCDIERGEPWLFWYKYENLSVCKWKTLLISEKKMKGNLFWMDVRLSTKDNATGAGKDSENIGQENRMTEWVWLNQGVGNTGVIHGR